MGAENSILENCKWDDVIATSFGADWSLRLATLRDDTTVTVFQHKKKDRKEVDLLHRGTKNLRTLRHPNLLRYIASGENSDGSYLVTEQVQPLENCLASLHPLEICAGLQSVLEALLFLHDTVGVTHNNVCLSSVYVTTDGSWKLGGLEHSCKFQEATAEFLDKCLAFRSKDSISPEEEEDNISAATEQGHARDVFAFGVFAEQLLEKLEDLGDLTKTFELRVQDECLNADPSQRPHVLSLLNDRLFRHDFLDVLRFVKNVTTKSEDEKGEFFRTVSPKLLSLPEELVAKCLAVPLLSRFVMLDETANKFMLPNLLTPYKDTRPRSIQGGQPTPILSEELFKANIIPELFRIFHIRDAHIRMVLLTHFATYVDLFDVETLEEVIFPQLLIGLRDTNDKIVAASLRSLSYLVPILGGDLIIGGSRKKFFSEGMPKFNVPGRDNEKNRKMRNVSGIMGKKMLLKDLASLGTTNGAVISENDEKEAKKKEREQRREEARLRREERKKKLQEQQKNETNKNLSQDTQYGRGDDVQEEGIIPDNKVCEVSEEENRTGLRENENEKADWSDWEEDKIDKRTSAQSDDLSFDEDKFSDEIENELRSMPTTVAVSPKTPNDDAPPIPMPRVDWSDAVDKSEYGKSDSHHSQTKGALRLGHSKSKSESKRDSKIIQSKPELSEWDETWDSVGSITNTAGSTESTKHSSTSKLSQNKKNVIKTNIPSRMSDLGSEFDIKVVPAKKTSTSSEPDFFSDMMPSITISHKDLLTGSVDHSHVVKFGSAAESPKKEEAKPVSFAVLEGEAQDGGGETGWDDDLDWGTEDF